MVLNTDKTKYAIFSDTEIKKFQDTLFNYKFEKIKLVYFDILYLQDLFFGYILAHVTTEEKYKYLISKIPEYNKRYEKKLCCFFEELGLEDNVVYERVYSDKYTKNLEKISPFTNVFYILGTIINTILRSNTRLSSEQEAPFTIFINTYPFNYSDIFKKKFKYLIKQINSKIIIGFINEDITKISPKIWNDAGILFIENMTKFLQEDSTGSNCLKQNYFTKSIIFSPKILDTENITYFQNENIDEIFEKTKILLNFETTFNYLTPQIPLVDD